MKPHRYLALLLFPAAAALAQGTDPTQPTTSSPPVSSEVEAARQRAASTPDGGRAGFRALDADSDGKVSPQEAAADSVLSEVFAKADRNSDGFVDGLEYGRYEKARNKAAQSVTE
jgi:hypothetical protein